MGWLTKIFKGSSHKITEGQYHGKYEDDRIGEEPPASALLSASDVVKMSQGCGTHKLSLCYSCANFVFLGLKFRMHRSDFDREEIDLAIARSLAEEDVSLAEEDVCLSEEDEKGKKEEDVCLSEEDEKGKKVIDSESQSNLEEDELLAKALQESLNVESPPRYDYGGYLSPYSYYYPSGYRICAGCNR
ncbi:LIM zinc-binding domain-containing protein [Abeliophyllum distichum]|uniref:LIM zinc-binding domain-containing protein n=1 Tax=Abeliophyllum distichum TaxID=126358 RepID=A0ABD1SJ38_9LAMI